LQLIIAIRSLAAGATVQQVSGELGYDSVSAFITMFKKALGASPAKYLMHFIKRQEIQLQMRPTGEEACSPMS